MFQKRDAKLAQKNTQVFVTSPEDTIFAVFQKYNIFAMML
jgi:hypothetical protein